MEFDVPFLARFGFLGLLMMDEAVRVEGNYELCWSYVRTHLRGPAFNCGTWSRAYAFGKRALFLGTRT